MQWLEHWGLDSLVIVGDVRAYQELQYPLLRDHSLSLLH